MNEQDPTQNPNQAQAFDAQAAIEAEAAATQLLPGEENRVVDTEDARKQAIREDQRFDMKAEGFDFVMNVPTRHRPMRVSERPLVPRLQEKHGKGNVRTDRAFDVEGNPLPTMRSVYVKREGSDSKAA